MKKLSFLFILSMVVALLLQTSCNIEKRHYRTGFYVENGSTKNIKNTLAEKQSSSAVVINNSSNSAINESDTEKESQPVFHQSAEEHLMNTATPAFAHKAIPAKTEAKAEVKQMNKNEAVKALKENAKALAFYAQSQKANKRGGGGEQIIALLLCFFLGMLGVHSFYLGNKKKGIWQLVMFLVGLLTIFILIGYFILSALGIWVLIDFIRIIIGDLGPGW